MTDENQFVRAANTFQEACLFNGLLNDVKEAMSCFEYAMISGTPPMLRSLFITQTNHSGVSDSSNI